jgi:hypothetical protein
MALTIAAAPPAPPLPIRTAPPPAAARAAPAPPQPAAAPAASKQQEQAALNQLVTRYAVDQRQGIAGNALSALGKQITAAAKLLGQHVTLPRGPAAAVAAPPPGTVNLTV